MLKAATVSGAKKSKTEMLKFEGFQMWRPFTRRTYFDMMETMAQTAYGQNAGDRTRMPTLIPLM